MIEMYLKYDIMHTNVKINAFINKHVNSCIKCMLSCVRACTHTCVRVRVISGLIIRLGLYTNPLICHILYTEYNLKLYSMWVY